MSIEVKSYFINMSDFESLQKEFTSSYLSLTPDYREAIQNNQIELLLSDDEIFDLEAKLDLLHIT